jgi:hypothetical protein
MVLSPLLNYPLWFTKGEEIRKELQREENGKVNKRQEITNLKSASDSSFRRRTRCILCATGAENIG